VVRNYYVDILERAPSDAEVASWENSGLDYAAIAKAILTSPEGRRRAVRDVFLKYLHRDAEPAAQDGYGNDANFIAGHPENVVSGILASPEYYQNNGSNDWAFVTALYRDVLGRTASTAEITSWLQAAHASRQAVAHGFLTSPEYREYHLVAGWYTKYLRRAGSLPELAQWLTPVQADADQWDLQAEFLSGPEYIGLHTCQATPPAQLCLNALADCGTLYDECGQPVDCGACPFGQTCGGGGLPNVCGGGVITGGGDGGPGDPTPPGCIPVTCAQLGMSCGMFGDACGGILDCGPCL
jgi:hypothetical protein